MYKLKYKTPKGFSDIILASDGKYLTMLYFEGSRNIPNKINAYEEKNIYIFDKSKKWLDIYFTGKDPGFDIEYKTENITPFRKSVIDIISKIPFGSSVTYNDIAKQIAKERGLKKMSAQAVGGAVGSNPICIIIPCHRVVGSNGSLVGYGGGIKNKIKLLETEKNDMSKFKIPKKGTKL